MTDYPTQPAGWYYAQGDPPGTQRYWDGSAWVGGPQPVAGASGAGGSVASSSALAEPGARIGARIIDGIVWAVIGGIVGGIFGTFSAGFALANGDSADISVIRVLLAGIVSTLLVAAYEIFMVGNQGATLGKMALGTKVVNADGSPADVQTGTRRMYLYIAVGILSALPVLGFVGSLANFIIAVAGLIMLFTDDQRQTPWDKIGKTLVVKK